MTSLQCRYETVAQNMSCTQERLKSLYGKRKTFQDSSDEFDPQEKKLKLQEIHMDEDLPSCYSYKLSKPKVKSRCLSSPGLCSPKKSVKRQFTLPEDLEAMFELNSNQVGVANDDSEGIETSFKTPIPTKTKCLSSPGLCNTFPK